MAWNYCCGKRIHVYQTIQEENRTIRYCKCLKCERTYKTEEMLYRTELERQVSDLVADNRRLNAQ